MEPLSRIACVDDDPFQRALVEIAMTEPPALEVKSYGSGEQILAAAPDARPQLVLLDVMMPGIDGVETLRRLRAEARTAAIPVVLMTAQAGPADLARYREAGAVYVIAKPVNPIVLRERLAQIWRAVPAA